MIIDKKLVIPYRVLVLIAYVVFITLINIHDFESIKSVGYYGIHMVAIALYLMYTDNRAKLCKVLYYSASILTIYGILQEFGYILGISAIYDPTVWGFYRFIPIPLFQGTIRIWSLYSEPAHLAGILCIGILIGLLGIEDKSHEFDFTNKIITFLMFVVIMAGVSATAYVGLVVTLITWLLISDIGRKYKAYAVAGFVGLFGAVFIIFRDIFYSIVVYRIAGLISEYNIVGNGTTFAIISNFRVALLKMKELGIFGTGMDSNRIWYYDYVDRIYGADAIYMNADDAASVFTRVFSEFGIIGFILLAALIVYMIIKGVKNKDKFLMIMVALFIIEGMRDGTYVNVVLSIPFAYFIGLIAL
ncbi:O-antigen ligase family protein [Butyrivibrio fibrisolvens]|uniref:O-antigen ligase family protein n=1 Tax=Butyrivibrio fibrisolvens TaxID=831 RepID=UPI0003FACC62|nr:O-antigen ligase family protein [Butyrivibrio fibrisolvens]